MISIRNDSKGFGALQVILVIVIVAILGFTSWYILRSQQTSNKTLKSTSTTQSKQITTKPKTTPTTTDPSEGGKYLVIKEWGVKTLLPSAFHSKISYALSTPQTDPDGNELVSAELFIATNAFQESVNPECATYGPGGNLVNAEAQYVRSENSKPFNTSRYKDFLKANILKDSMYSYHLIYAGSYCLDQDADIALLAQLDQSLATLIKE